MVCSTRDLALSGNSEGKRDAASSMRPGSVPLSKSTNALDRMKATARVGVLTAFTNDPCLGLFKAMSGHHFSRQLTPLVAAAQHLRPEATGPHMLKTL